MAPSKRTMKIDQDVIQVIHAQRARYVYCPPRGGCDAGGCHRATRKRCAVEPRARPPRPRRRDGAEAQRRLVTILLASALLALAALLLALIEAG